MVRGSRYHTLQSVRIARAFARKGSKLRALVAKGRGEFYDAQRRPARDLLRRHPVQRLHGFQITNVQGVLRSRGVTVVNCLSITEIKQPQ